MEEIEELDPDNTNIFKQNMIGRYICRPNSQYKNGMYDIVDHICFEIFLAHYYLGYENKDENDSQPDVLGDETKETPQGISETLPKLLPLMSSSEKLKLRKTTHLLRYHVPNKHLHFRDENALKVIVKSWLKKVLHTINENKRFFDPNFEKINNVFVKLSQVLN